MPDFNFEITEQDLLSGAGHHACRLAVLWPLSFVQPKLTASIKALQDKWRVRLCVLQRHGWSPIAVQGAKVGETFSDKDPAYIAACHKLQYLRNCPPFGVKPKVQARRCKRMRVCPMCYARDIVFNAYQSAEWLLHRTAIGCEHGKDLQAVVIRKEVVRPARMLTSKGMRAAGQNLLYDYDLVKAIAWGGFANITIEPAKDPANVLIRRSTLIILPATNMAAQSEWVDHPEIRFAINPNRQDLGKLVGWGFPYPTGMITGDPALTVKILDAMSLPALTIHNATKKMPWRLTKAMGLLDNKQWRDCYSRLRYETKTKEKPHDEEKVETTQPSSGSG